MQSKKLLSKLPFIVAVVLYALISYGYFAPQLAGEVLYQHDVEQYEGMTQDILECRRDTGNDPQWSGSMFGGMPAYLINVAYPAQIIKRTFSAVTNTVSAPAGFIFFAMLSMWLMLVMMGVNGWVAIVGGLMYGLSTYFFLIIEAGHITKMWALVYAPLMFGGVYLALRKNMWWGAALTALAASAQIGANHPQITYYFAMAIAAFYISELYFSFKESRLADFSRRSALLVVAALLALCSNLSPLWYTYQHTPDTIRGGSALTAETSTAKGLDMEYATAWSYGRAESLNMLAPNFVGGSSFDTFSQDGAVAESLAPYDMQSVATQLPAYWGGQPFTGGPTYIGAVVIMLALFGIAISRGRERWWLVAITVLMILLAWGRNMMWFTELIFKILPGYNKFRTVSMTLTVVEWTMPLLATMALAKLWAERTAEQSKEYARKLLRTTAIVGGVMVAIIAAAPMLFGFGREDGFSMLVGAGFPDSLASEVANAMVAERLSILRLSMLRSLCFMGVSVAVLFFTLRGKLSRMVMLAALALLVMLDMVPVARQHLNGDDFRPARSAKIFPTDADKAIMADTDPGYRVLNLTVSPFNDATTSYFHRSVGGYHGAKLSRYQDIIDTYFSSSLSDGILDMLNTRYLIVAGDDGKPAVHERTSALGAAWFVDEAVYTASAREEIDMLAKVDLASSMVVDFDQVPSSLNFGAGTIELQEYHPNHLTYTYQASSPGTVVFSEIFYDKGWSAYIDGEEAPYFRADYTLRAMEVPAGAHTIVWRFKAPRWSLIEGITLTASLVIILGIIALIIVNLYERRQKIKA